MFIKMCKIFTFWTEIHFTHVNVQCVFFLIFGWFFLQLSIKNHSTKNHCLQWKWVNYLYTFNFCHNRRPELIQIWLNPYYSGYSLLLFNTLHLKLEFISRLLRRSKTSSRSVCEAFYCTVSYSCNHKTVLISLVMFFVYLIMKLNNYIEV